MNFAERWFPATDGGGVVGRFSEAPKVDVRASEAKGKNVYLMVPVLLSKIPGSSDVSSQQVKPFNEKELTARFPGAWEYFQAQKAEETAHRVETKEEVKPMVGTPLHEADFLPRDKLAWLQTIGFTTIESIAEMSDAVAQNLKSGTTWRKKAIEFLKRT